MAKLEVFNNLTRSFNRLGLKAKKHSPEILVVGGVIGLVTSAVLACKATTKLDEVLKEPKEKIEKINEFMENPESVPNNEEYTIEDGKKDLVIMYGKSALAVTKLYAPAVVLGALSVTAILSGHNITRKRNVALAAAYATVNRSFKDYRNRLIERFGSELDKELKYNIKAKEVENVVVDEKTGEEKTVTEIVNVADPYLYSDYAKFFDEACPGWTKDPEYNLTFLKAQQRFANEKLKARGYLFLNEVYDMIGVDRTKAGQVVGWIYDEKNPIGDNFVDFGIYEINRERNRAFVNGTERSILLDFNVDGPILDLI